ncbi:hypothetical protein LJY25_08300 [Hymenobacter sp. BT175]|uniref:hypothetical protein n=1 Tax=Hymenobacter translucens TaxID=2886507 RepID=UPI001D0DFC0F|nr:hypothetical protein [Hymenobacter translucens]MCC2546442.1 hypothetical protein [Hymenobacter translucens]
MILSAHAAIARKVDGKIIQLRRDLRDVAQQIDEVTDQLDALTAEALAQDGPRLQLRLSQLEQQMLTLRTTIEELTTLATPLFSERP